MDNQKRKRLWVHRIEQGKVTIWDGHTACAICRTEFKLLCVYCQENDPGDELKNHQQFMKYVWIFLLIEQKRPGSPFSMFDANVISKIYQFAISGCYTPTLCSLVTLECKHTFHRHCLEHWVFKYRQCPLCANNSIMPIKIQNEKRKKCDGTLAKIFESELSYKQFLQQSEDKLYVQTVVCNLLKHNYFGYDYSKLYKLSSETRTHGISKTVFDYILNELIRKEYVKIQGDNYVKIIIYYLCVHDWNTGLSFNRNPGWIHEKRKFHSNI